MKSNIPQIKLGLVAVSRNCFPISLSERRRLAVAEECAKLNLPLTELKTVIEVESDALKRWMRHGRPDATL